MKLVPGTCTLKQTTVFTLAALQVIFGIVTLIFNRDIFQRLLDSQLVVREGTKTFAAWKESPIPIYIKFYFFNMVNADDFEKNHAKPILEEKGPYTFRQEERKVNLVWHEDATISYNRQKRWYFEPDMSTGSLQDTVNTLNVPMVTAVDYAREDFIMEFGLSDMLSTIEAKLFINRTLGELLFDGYDDPVLEIGTSFEDEETVPLEKFGWFYKRNGTSWADGGLRMYTGVDNIEKLGQIHSWNQRNTTDAFSGQCSAVTGSADGLLAPGLLRKAESFDIWSTDSCRKLTFERAGSLERHGLTVDRFQLADNVFDNGTACEGNLCYQNNLPTGVQNVSHCKMKAPAYLSRPHFYQADPSYQQQFQVGIQPDPERHQSFFLIEPHTSIPVQVNMALQLNVKIEASEGMEHVFKELPTVFFPVLWFESGARLPQSMAGALLTLINIPYIMVAASIVGVLAGLAGMMAVTRRVVRAGLKSNHGNNESKNSRLFCILQDKTGEESEQPVGENSKALLS